MFGVRRLFEGEIMMLLKSRMETPSTAREI
jgi:hypothetical protein